MASGRMAPSNAKSGRNVDPTLRPDSRLAFRRQVRQTHGTHGTQGIIFADVNKLPYYSLYIYTIEFYKYSSNKLAHFGDICDSQESEQQDTTIVIVSIQQ